MLICAKCSTSMTLHNRNFDCVSEDTDRYECGACGLIIKVAKGVTEHRKANLTLVPKEDNR